MHLRTQAYLNRTKPGALVFFFESLYMIIGFYGGGGVEGDVCIIKEFAMVLFS